MTGSEFKIAIKKNPKNIYCLESIDSAMVDLYMNRFKEAIKADNVSYGKIKPTGKLFLHKTLNVIYLEKLDEELFERKEFIFAYTDKIDKRTSAYKKYKDQIIEINNDYTQYIKEHSSMTDEQIAELIRRSNNNFSIILNSIKMFNISGEFDFIDYSNDIYDWVEKFIRNEKLPNTTESPISLIALLSNNCYDILKIKRKQTNGMNQYRITCLMNLLDYRTEEELISIINDCFYLDCKLKQGLFNSNNIVDYMTTKYHKE